jgi:hypothetical protein
MPLSVPQREIVRAPQRFKVAVCGRRFGKTTLAIWLMCREAAQPNREIFYIAPTYRQAKMIAWKKLKNKLLDLRWVKKINETELSIVLKNDSVISLKGADGGAQNLRGVGLDAVIMDEASIIDQEAWTEVLRPALADKQGWALFISTPAGMNWLKDLYDLADEFPDEWASFQFTSIQGGNIPEAEIEAARRTLDARTFQQEFEASFVNFSGRVFYGFDRKYNVKPYEGDLPYELLLGADFNLDPMSAVVAVRNKDVLHIVDEIKIMGSNTDELVAEIKSRYPDKRIVAFPDPAGAQRKTSAGGKTDHTILRNAGFAVKAHTVTSSVRDGINAVNSKLRSSDGHTTLFVDPRCKFLIECLEKQTYKEGTSQPDKSRGWDHMNDALRYLTEYLFPIRQPIVAPPVRMWSHKIADQTHAQLSLR